MDGLAQIGFTRSDRIAIIYARDEEKHKFAETVAYNQGWQNIRYFADIEEAEVWINGNRLYQ